MTNEIRRTARQRLLDYESGQIPKTLSISVDDRRLNRCPLCGYRLDFAPFNPRFELQRCNLDISATHDGQVIVSSRFRDFCVIRKLEGIEFRAFDKAKNHFQLIATQVIPFDAKRRGTRFEYLCPVCNNYESVVGANPVYLSVSIPLRRGIFRSDLLFASGNEKSPITVVSSDLKMEMEHYKLNGADFAPAYGE